MVSVRVICLVQFSILKGRFFLVITLALVGLEMIVANSTLHVCGLLTNYHLIFNVRSWDSC